MLETSLIVLILIGDQLTKYLTERFLPLGASYPLWEGVFEFTNVHNTGAAWGMFSGGRAFFIVTWICRITVSSSSSPPGTVSSQ